MQRLREGTRWRPDAGLNLIELLITLVILLFLWLVMAVGLLSRHGMKWWTVSFLAAPLGLWVLYFVVSRIELFLYHRGPEVAVERVLRALEAGDAEKARRAFGSLPLPKWQSPVRSAIGSRRSRVVAAVRGPWPGREIAYRLDILLDDRFGENLSAPLLDSLLLLPEDLFPSALRDIAWTHEAMEPARALLGRTSTEASRRRLLGTFFVEFPRIAPATPTKEWVALLRPHRAVLEELSAARDYPAQEAERLRSYLREMS